MINKIWNKKIPTLFGVLLIVLGLSITTFLVKNGSLLKINASPTTEPKEVRISNVTDTSFTVSYQTEDSVVGSINYGKDQNTTQAALDEKDEQNVSSHKIHSITVRNLDPQTSYVFTITSGQQTYLNEGHPFSVSTGPQISDNPPEQNPISGKVILPDSTVPSEAIIYLTLENSQVISTLIKPDGSYLIPLNSLRTSDLSSYFSLSSDSLIKMLVFGDGQKSNVTLLYSQTSPAPIITLSEDFEFSSSETPVATPSSSLNSFPSFTSTESAATASKKPEILTPQEDQNFSDQQPTFKGKALPNEEVQVIIHSDQQISTSIKADSGGNWNFRPDSPLDPGNHTITIIAKDGSGILRTITQSFVVYAEGQQINPGVPSPTDTLGPRETLTPTIFISPTPTATPTAAVSITGTPTPTSKVLPPTGDSSIFLIGSLGIVITVIGGLLFLLALRGSSVL